MIIEVGELDPPEFEASADIDGSIHSSGRLRVTQAMVGVWKDSGCWVDSE